MGITQRHPSVILWRGSEPPLIFDYYHPKEIETVQKGISYNADYNSIIQKIGITELGIFSYKRLNIKVKVVLEGHLVAMVTYWATNVTATCSLMHQPI